MFTRDFVLETLILPIKFCIKFRIALLTPFTNVCTEMLFKIINLFSVSSHYCLRVNKWSLQNVSHLNLAKSESIFSFAASKIWNSLLCHCVEGIVFCFLKQRLKSHYFSVAFDNVATV